MTELLYQQFQPGALTCRDVESAATLCKLRHRDAHLALETLSGQDSSSSVSARCFLAETPELRRKIIHRDRLIMRPLPVAGIFFYFFFFFLVSSGGVERQGGCSGGVI